MIDENGEMMGVVSTAEALQRARLMGVDLVEISPNAVPPVCKILDYGKYCYELQKKSKEAKKKQKKVTTKEVKLSPRIAVGDYNIKLERAKKFISEGDKVRVSLLFKGREITHNDVGYDVMQRFKDDMVDIASVEVEPKMEGRQIFMVLIPSVKG